MNNFLSYLAGRQSPRSHLVILLGIAVVMLALPAGLWDVRGPDEGRYTQIAKELLTRDNWFALTVLGQPYDQKPPLAFWMLAGGLKLSGGEVYSGVMRMPSVLAALGLLAVTYLLGRRFGGARAGFFSGLFLLTSLSYIDDSAVVELNMLFGFFITASISVWLLAPPGSRLSWGRWAAMWLLLGAAFLIKGPVSLLVVLSALAGAAIWERSWQPFRVTRALGGLLLVFAIIGGWMAAQSMAWGTEFVEKQVSSETVGRLMKGDHEESFFYYFPRLFTAILGPWAVVFLAALWALARNRGNNPAYAGPLLGWLAIPFIIFLLANGKRVPYLVPLLAPACLLAGTWARERLDGKVMPPWGQRGVVVVVLAGAVVLGAAGLLLFFPEVVFRTDEVRAMLDVERFWPVAWLAAAAGLGAVAAAFLRSQRRWFEGFWAIGLVIVTLHLVDAAVVRPALDPGKSTRAFSDKVGQLLREHNETTLLTLPELEQPEFHVYGHYAVKSGRRHYLDLTEAGLPRVLALKSQEIETSGSQAVAAGYLPVADMKVTKKDVRLYVRKP